MIDFEEVYQDYLEDVYRFSLALCRDPVLAEELTQETFFRALEHIGQFRGECTLRVWLCQIAKHLWYQHLRKANRETELPEEAELPLVPSAEEEAVSRSGQLDMLRSGWRRRRLPWKSTRYSTACPSPIGRSLPCGCWGSCPSGR